MDFQPGEVVQVREDSRFQFFDMAKKNGSNALDRDGDREFPTLSPD
jgi:hypothetical protein